MIDGREYAKRKQCDGERVKRRRETGANERQPAADIERNHHIAAAPAIGEPARRQREQSERNEGGGSERDQLRIGTAIDDLELDHHGRKDQNHEVIKRVSPIEEADREPPARQISRPGGRK
jgi:hypothetical protein